MEQESITLEKHFHNLVKRDKKARRTLDGLEAEIVKMREEISAIAKEKAGLALQMQKFYAKEEKTFGNGNVTARKKPGVQVVEQ